MARGNITKRGRSSWRIKFDCGTDEEGRRQYHVETVKGTKADAQALLAKRLNELAEGRHVNRSGETVESYAMHWLENIAPNDRCAATVERYRSLIRAHIIPGLGGLPLQVWMVRRSTASMRDAGQKVAVTVRGFRR